MAKLECRIFLFASGGQSSFLGAIQVRVLNPISTVRVKSANPWQIQLSVVFALFLREMQSRFGQFRLGYLWAVLEPISMIVILSGVRVIFGTGDVAGLPYPVFFASGILTYLLFNHILISCLTAVESNLGLFNYQRVKPFDVAFSRLLLELLIVLGTAMVIFPGLYYLGYRFTINEPLRVVWIIACLLGMSFGIGLMLCVLGPLWQEAKKVVPVVIRPFFFISGIFFSASMLPNGVRELALLNPLLHFVELMRASLFVEYESHEGSLFYVFAWALGCLFVGMWLYRLFRVKIVTSGSIR